MLNDRRFDSAKPLSRCFVEIKALATTGLRCIHIESIEIVALPLTTICSNTLKLVPMMVRRVISIN